MKKNILIIMLLAIVATAFKTETKVKAIPDQEEGIYVFARSTPENKYKSLGKVNMPEVVWNGKPKEMMNTAIRRAKRQFPTCNGIIFQSDNFGKVEAIQIEE